MWVLVYITYIADAHHTHAILFGCGRKPTQKRPQITSIRLAMVSANAFAPSSSQKYTTHQIHQISGIADKTQPHRGYTIKNNHSQTHINFHATRSSNIIIFGSAGQSGEIFTSQTAIGKKSSKKYDEHTNCDGDYTLYIYVVFCTWCSATHSRSGGDTLVRPSMGPAEAVKKSPNISRALASNVTWLPINRNEICIPKPLAAVCEFPRLSRYVFWCWRFSRGANCVAKSHISLNV